MGSDRLNESNSTKKRLLKMIWAARRKWGMALAALAVVVYGLVAWGIGKWERRQVAAPVCPGAAGQAQNRVYMPFVTNAYSPPGKKGVGDTYNVCEAAELVGADYRYNWSYNPGNCPNAEDIPMVWGLSSWGRLQANPSLLGGDSNCLMGPNECDRKGQCNATPYEVAVMWRELEAWLHVHAPRITCLVSPAPSHINPDWLDQFRAHYITLYGEAPQLDYLAVHCYGGFEFCKGQIQDAIAKCRAWEGCKGVWVTEFAYWPNWSASQGIAEMGKLVAWMEEIPEVDRYFWFQTYIKNDGSEPWWYGGHISPMTPSLVSCSQWQGDTCLRWQLTEFGYWYWIAHTWRF